VRCASSPPLVSSSGLFAHLCSERAKDFIFASLRGAAARRRGGMAGSSSLDTRYPAFGLSHGGEQRAYIAVNATADDRPVLVLLHWFGGTAAQMVTRVRDAVDLSAWSVIAPNGASDHSFNGGACCGLAAQRRIDDVGLVDVLVADALRARRNRRVALMGFSNGAFLGSHVALRAKQWTLDRAVFVAGSTYDLAAYDAATTPVHVLVVHGLRDEHVNMRGCCADVRCCWCACLLCCVCV